MQDYVFVCFLFLFIFSLLCFYSFQKIKLSHKIVFKVYCEKEHFFRSHFFGVTKKNSINCEHSFLLFDLR